ncbi:hypothetical protein [Kushneria sp. EE4]
MVTERARRQYLDAMGINLWVARHSLPNALASDLPALEEAPEQAIGSLDHHQRLHALIDEIDHSEAPTPGAEVAETPPHDPTPPARSVRALLDIGKSEEKRSDAASVEKAPAPVAEDKAVPAATKVEDSVSRAPHEPLRFSLQVGTLDGRWLILLARDEALSTQEETLLNAILYAGGVQPAADLSCQRFGWPMMEGLPVDDALDEARQGFKAFLAGRRARGWHPERLLLFGQLPVLEEVLDVHDGQSRVLDLPLWQGPALESLDEPASRRQLWAAMGEWRTWWQAPSQTQDGHDH